MASEADLLKLHAQLESSASARGGGGLGFEKMSGKRKDGQTKASKLLQKQQKREFASTTAGAIAAGHWDPWARPVEFKMKAANTRAGGLYSMFVQGGTMGGTIKDVPNKAKKKDDKKDLRKDIQAAGDAGENSPVNFKWKHHIKATLQQAKDRELPFKEVRKLVLKDYKKTVGATKFQKDDCRKEFKRKVAEMATVEKAGGMLRFRAARND